ncbi:hypothetical protein O3M35_011155 [Rhynocoris fuscipes]|uniref:Carboxylesterase type B domain-containing protein n=1 Tax=Rhynocoris fuscipes TaxID=488301 RepID=A0AAW1CV76_9HEMI
MNILCMLLFTRCGDFVTNTTEGPVSGYQMKSRSGRSFIAFSGIPYAAPPIGKLRFQVSGWLFFFFLFF